MGIRPRVAYIRRDHIDYDEKIPVQHGLVGVDFPLGCFHHLYMYHGQRASLKIFLGSWHSECSYSYYHYLVVFVQQLIQPYIDILRCSRPVMAVGQFPHLPGYRSR
jgi:hypothetical protein